MVTRVKPHFLFSPPFTPTKQIIVYDLSTRIIFHALPNGKRRILLITSYHLSSVSHSHVHVTQRTSVPSSKWKIT